MYNSMYRDASEAKHFSDVQFSAHLQATVLASNLGKNNSQPGQNQFPLVLEDTSCCRYITRVLASKLDCNHTIPLIPAQTLCWNCNPLSRHSMSAMHKALMHILINHCPAKAASKP